MNERLKGRRAIVTGGSSGIGAATARRFVEEGAAVAICARREPRLRKLAAELGDAVVPVVVDVSDPRAVERAVREACAAIGPIDALVNCAAILEPRALHEIDPETWRRTIDVNLSGSFYMAREVALVMREHSGGHIINIGSDLSFLGVPLYTSYAASKSGILGLTRALAVELAPSINVNAICPGPVETPMLTAEFESLGNPDELRAEASERLPLKRFATPEEIAAAALYLTADGGFATGSALVIDGGSTIV